MRRVNRSTMTILLMSAAIGGQNAPVVSAGLVPGLIGVFEVNVRVPEQPAGTYPLVIQAGGVPSNQLAVNVSP